MRLTLLAAAVLALAACPIGPSFGTSTGTGTSGGSSSSGTAGTSGCGATADCGDLTTVCVDGGCVTDVCPADAGLYSLCDAAGAWDGTCVPEVEGAVFAACQQGGTAQSSCTSAGTRGDLAQICPAGGLCYGESDGGPGTCGLVCQSDTGLPCAGDQVCLPYELVGTAGFCFDEGDGGCIVDLPGAAELATCQSPSGCGCPFDCTLNPGIDGFSCELPCGETSDCPTATTSCTSGFCGPSYCASDPLGRATGDAGFGDPCDAEGTGDGICSPAYVVDEDGTIIFAYGLCREGGALPLGSSCILAPLRDGGLCSATSFCVATGDGGVCAQVCAPLDGGGCPASQGCFSVIPPPYPSSVGVCRPCTAEGGVCLNSSECCGGSCDPDAGSCG